MCYLDGMRVMLTPAAREKLLEMLREQPEGTVFRIRKGGCGVRFVIEPSTLEPGEIKLEVEGIPFADHPLFAQLAYRVDWVSSRYGSYFSVDRI